MVKRLNRGVIFILFSIALLLILSLCAYADIPPYQTFEDDDFIEGEGLTEVFQPLDTLVFNYYDEEYSFRVLGVYAESAYVRADGTAIEINLWDTHYFNIDDDDDYDLNVTLTDIDSDDQATFKFELNMKYVPEPEPEPEVNNTNTTDTNTTNTTTTGSDGEPDPDPDPEPGPEEEPEEEETDTTGPTGDVVYDINININIPPGGGFGALIIAIIVLGGLFAYKKVKKGAKEKEERREKGLPELPKGPSKFKQFRKGFGKRMKKGRKWLGHKISGEEIQKKKKR